MRSTRVLTALTALAILAIMAAPTLAATRTRWTGADYCAVYSAQAGWSSIGGGSCNPTPATQANASWTRSYILDFTGHKVYNAKTRAVVSNYASLTAMMTGIQQYASPGWMWVANKKGGTAGYVFLLVKKSSCSGSSEWAIAPAC